MCEVLCHLPACHKHQIYFSRVIEGHLEREREIAILTAEAADQLATVSSVSGSSAKRLRRVSPTVQQ